MNSPKQLALFFLQWEGGLSKSLKDSASKFMCPTVYKGHKWHTNKGVTYSTWVSIFGTKQDMRFLEMNNEDWTYIMKKRYWDAIKGDKMPFQAAADVLTSWAWGSGAETAIKQVQRMLNIHFEKDLDDDGSIGKFTIDAISEVDPVAFFKKACETRESFFRYISDEKNGKNEEQRERFRNNAANLQGWLNRLSMFKKKFHP